MNSAFRRSFERDLRKVRDADILRRVRQAIQDVEAAGSLQEVRSLEKMSGTSSFYRIRIGDYRIGIAVEGDEVEFIRCLHRRDIYRYFP